MKLDRRSLIAGSLALAATPAIGAPRFESKRPANRHFTSKAVERELVRVSAKIGDPELRGMFGNCYPNTLDTTVFMGTVDGKPDTCVITGDIECLWLRDSSAQLNPYVHLTPHDAKLRELFHGLIARQARSILIDPYANAFLRDPAAKTNLSWALADDTEMKPGVAERKWEIDSLCYPMRLAHDYWKASGDAAPFDALWAEAARTSIRTFREQQRKDSPGPYRFLRRDKLATETQILDGYGAPTKKIGMIHSMYRPSDDACIFPFLVPANLFAVAALRKLAIVASEAAKDNQLATDAKTLADEVEAATRSHGTMIDPATGERLWAYEVDGFGNGHFMDDANVPSLSALAYLGAVPASNPLFQRTAAAAWSERNPYFFKGAIAEGIGGPHAGLRMIWPMSIIMRALNSEDDVTIRQCLRHLKASHGGTGFIHEAFDQDDATTYTRHWFAWANGLFGELMLDLARRKPALLGAPL
ncbi:glycoside hydrolase family 125 protein [Sphingobium sp.]|uniref:glycoside hydrolase family 125 protein n=1 Tax=Sphingobium sp. TaxID=1912891 RepID=UPI0028BEB8F7|nr:glycoside hydrolase family 125 protein [Sphingobium sp.]